MLADRAGDAGRITWIGRVSRDALVDYFSLCDVFVMPASSRSPDVEGFGLVFLEASACGKPVIGANEGGIPDAVIHGETGLLVGLDNRAELAAAVSSLLRDECKAASMGAAGRRRVEATANWHTVAETILAEVFARL